MHHVPLTTRIGAPPWGPVTLAMALMLAMATASAQTNAPPAEITPSAVAKAVDEAAAAAEAGTPAPTAPLPAPIGVTRADAYAEFRKLYDANQHEAAAAQGKRVVELTRADPAATPEELQVALMNLAAAQTLAQDLSGAESSYLEVVSLLEGEGRMTSARLARAVAGLATTYHATKRYELAAQAFDRAISLSRRSEGLFNVEQLPLLDRYEESLTEIGDYEKALQAHSYGLRVAERAYGAEDQRTLDRLERLGRWYTRVGAYEAGRQALRSEIRLIERKQGEYSIELIGPLTAIAESYRRQLLDPEALRESVENDRNNTFHESSVSPGVPGRTISILAAEGERSLERAVGILDRDPSASPLQVADVRTQMGDWFQTRLQHDKALPHYKLAWDAAGKAPDVNGKPLRDVLFSKPVLLHYLRPTDWDRYAKRPKDEIAARTVEIDLTVGADGRVRGRKLVSNEGGAGMAEEALEAADSARYRPRFVDGAPVETTDVRLTQTYFEPIEPASQQTPAGDWTPPAAAEPGKVEEPSKAPATP